MADQAIQLWNESDVAFVRRQIVPQEVTDQEFRLLIHRANVWKLDPLNNEIYITKYYSSNGDSKAQIFVGLAGLLKIANRGGKLDGCEATIRRVDTPLEVSYKVKGNTYTYTRAWSYVARAVVHKRDCAHPFIAEVSEDEYSTGRNLWTTKPQTMLKKVATCQALRLAFALSGLYDEDEFGDRAPAIEATPDRKQMAAPAEQVIEGEAREIAPAPASADTPTVPRREWDQGPQAAHVDGQLATDKQLKAIYAIARAARHLSVDEVDARCQELYAVPPSELTKHQASLFIDALKGEQAA